MMASLGRLATCVPQTLLTSITRFNPRLFHPTTPFSSCHSILNFAAKASRRSLFISSAAPLAAARESHDSDGPMFRNLEQFFAHINSKRLNDEIVRLRGNLMEYNQAPNSQPGVYRDLFNLYTYDVLRNVPDYDQNVGEIIRKVQSNKKWPSDLIEWLFKPLESGTRHKKDLARLVDMMQSVKSEDIVAFQKHLLRLLFVCESKSEWESIYFKSHFNQVWKDLDERACELLKKSNLNDCMYQMLAISSLWYELGLARQVNFNRVLVRKLLAHEPEMDRTAMLHLMFTLSVVRNVDRHLVETLGDRVAVYLGENAQVNLGEMSIIAKGFVMTHSPMSSAMLAHFIPQCTRLLSSADTRNANDIYPLVTLLKSLIQSLKGVGELDQLLSDNIRDLVEVTCVQEAEGRLDDAAASLLPYLITLLNRANLYDETELYDRIVDRFATSLSQFPIADLERVLSNLAVAHYQSEGRLNVFVDHLSWKLIQTPNLSPTDALLYYSILYHLLVLNYCPRELVHRCADEKFLSQAYQYANNSPNPHVKAKLIETLILVETLLRLESEDLRLLSDEKFLEYYNFYDKCQVRELTTKKSRFLTNVRDILSANYPDTFRLITLFPFSPYPFPVLLSEEMAADIPKNVTTDNIFKAALPFNPKQLVPGAFQDCSAFLVLTMAKGDSSVRTDSQLRGFAHLQERLLERLGFRVILLEQKDFEYFTNLNPDEVQRESESYKDCEQTILDLVLLAEMSTKGAATTTEHNDEEK